MSKSRKTRRTKRTKVTRISGRIKTRRTKSASIQRALFDKMIIGRFVIVVTVLVGIFIVFGFLKGRAVKEQEDTLVPNVPSVYNESNRQSVSRPQYSPWTKKELSQKLSQYTKIPEEDLVFDVTERTVKDNKHFLYGALGEKGVTGGKHFYVVVELSNDIKGDLAAQYSIRVIYIGNMYPDCSIFDGLDVPSVWFNKCRE